ncbi:type VI secretion system Vgr family protein [Massilia sp. YIM B02763]|uniref:type VI secretion system Vgr family protein n=1 Tax=Massilia sp. YIM B02763 TaxID=3050130 RepID=UPI0025B63926|nr:type VI secretion system Vgr family protein [Massilia sp. YIM B02763]MDN4052315.1 type VI secretion system Vgr family protein [Massilia sp. YIM B02763]
MSNPRHSIHDLVYGRQYNRILRLSFPDNDAPAAQFVVNKIDATESLSRDFEFTVELLSDEVSVSLKEMQGKLLNIELVRKDGSLRYFSGYVFSFRRSHSDGGISFYEAKLGPWLKFLSLRKDNYLFHNKTMREQTEIIFRDYGTYPQWDWHVTGDDPVMTDACQFDETDFNYLSRRWEAAGWYYWYEHDATGHKLIVSSDSTQAPALDGGAEVRFHGESGAVEEDAIDRWSPVRQTMPSSVALNGFNFKDSRPSSVTLPTLNQQGKVPEIEFYEYAGAYGFKNFQDGDAQCRIRMEEIEAIAKHIEAEGNNRFLMPGRWFQLVDHFNHGVYGGSSDAGKDDFVILSVRHIATNNFLQEEDEKTLYRNWLTCTRKNVPWRPGRNFNSTDAKILAPQTAVVVGPSGPDSIHTDEYGRVRVQFHWDREGDNDERSSAWIRVSSSWAGAELGAAAIPRVGTEVIVQWLGGCPDRPIITGAVFNEHNMPPWTVPTQQALTGFRSRELTPNGGNTPAGRSNHLILDDTNGQIQAQLKSDHLHSQLSLGYITRIENNRGRADARGEGWELRTDGHGIARAAEGMLLTTERRTNSQSHIRDMGETIQRFKVACNLHESLSSQALQCQAQEKGQQDEVTDALQEQNAAIIGSGGKFPELIEPHLVLASPAGIETSTAQSTHISSDQHTAMTTGRSLSFATGEGLFASIKSTLRLFVHNAGMKLIAAGGNVTIQAQQDDVEIVARKVMSLISQSDWIELKGKKGIRLHGAEAMLEISDVVQFFTSKPVLFRGNLETLPASGRAHPNYISGASDIPPRSARGKFDERFHLVSEDGKTPLAHCRYRITAEDGQCWEGTTNAEGLTERVYTTSEQKLSLEML